MSVWPSPVSANPLVSSNEGELVQIRITTEPRLLEDLLECLAALSFPINPQIYHGVPTIVEFPAWEARLYEVRDAMRIHGFDPRQMRTSSMLQEIIG